MAQIIDIPFPDPENTLITIVTIVALFTEYVPVTHILYGWQSLVMT